MLTLRGKLREAEFLADEIVQAYEFEPYTRLDERGLRLGNRRVDFLGRCDGYPGTSTSGSNPYARRAVARTLRGKIREALSDFKQAEDFQKRKLRLLYQLNFAIRAFRREEKLGEPVPKGLLDQPVEAPSLIGQWEMIFRTLAHIRGVTNPSKGASSCSS